MAAVGLHDDLSLKINRAQTTHVICLQIRAAGELWDGTGTLLFTGSAGLFTVDDGSQCNEESPVAPLGVSERNDRSVAGVIHCSR